MDEDATNSNDFDGNDDHDNNETTATAAANRGSTEAGAMRGVARSLQNAGQRMVQFPVVGRLPAPRPTITTTTTTTTIQWKIPNLGLGKPSNLPKMRNHVPKPRMPGGAATATGSATATASSTAVRAGRSMPRPPPPPPPPKSIPVRQVAKLSDRVSTGLEVFDTAQETGVVSTRLSQSRVVSFGMSKFFFIIVITFVNICMHTVFMVTRTSHVFCDVCVYIRNNATCFDNVNTSAPVQFNTNNNDSLFSVPCCCSPVVVLGIQPW